MTLIQIVWNQKEVEEINPEHIISILKDHKHNYYVIRMVNGDRVFSDYHPLSTGD